MLEKFWSRFGIGPQDPTKIPRLVRGFNSADAILSRDDVAVDGKGWLIDAREDQVVRLFEVADPGVENCMLTYRAAMRSEDLQGRAYLEMWCRLPGQGEFFSRGLSQTIKRTTEWSSYEVPFRLKKGQRPDLIKLNVVVEGRGKVWIRSIELLQLPR
jgi:hypothetical protein